MFKYLASDWRTNGALLRKSAASKHVRVTAFLPPLRPILFRVPGPAGRSIARFLRCPSRCCPPAPRPPRARAGKLCVLDRAYPARSPRRRLPRASTFRPFPGALSSGVQRALPAKHPEKSSARIWETRRSRCLALPSPPRRPRRRAAVRQPAPVALLQSSRAATQPAPLPRYEFPASRPLRQGRRSSSHQPLPAPAWVPSVRCVYLSQELRGGARFPVQLRGAALSPPVRGTSPRCLDTNTEAAQRLVAKRCFCRNRQARRWGGRVLASLWRTPSS